MSLALLTHHHSYGDSPIHRLGPGWKLAVAVLVILSAVLAPAGRWAVLAGIAGALLVVLFLSRLPVLFVAKRLVLLSPFVLGVAVLNVWHPRPGISWTFVAAKSGLCLLTMILLANTTPFSELLRVLQRVRVPRLLVTTLALMHRYLFVLVDESERMRRARQSRTFTRDGRFEWKSLASVVGQLFVRASERAERIYDAMCARGWK